MINRLLILLSFFCCVSYSQQKICMGSIKDYSVDINENNGAGSTGSTYLWNISSPFSGTITPLNSSKNKIQVDWSSTIPGIYTITVDEINSSNCSKSSTLTVQVFENPNVDIEDQIICLNEDNQWISTPIFNTNLSSNYYEFQWYHNGVLLSHTDSSLTPTQTGTYKVIVKKISSQCTASDEAMVIERTPLEGSITVTNDFTNQPIIEAFINGGVAPYTYSIDGVNYQSSSTFELNDSGSYTVFVKDQSDCTVLKLAACVFTFDKFFTPNDDGINDYWTLNMPDKKLKATVTIYDRFGKLIKQFDPSKDNWDGKFNKEALFSTDYWFVLDYINCSGETKQFKSHFSLKR